MKKNLFLKLHFFSLKNNNRLFIESNNTLADEESYLNISVKYEILQASLEMLNTVMNEVHNENSSGDCRHLLINLLSIFLKICIK